MADQSQDNSTPASLAIQPGQGLCALSAGEMARLVASGEVSAGELAEAHIARIESVNPALNAVVVKRYEAAREEARGIDRRRQAGETLPPLAGLPITVKECFDLEGTPATFGLPSRAKAIGASDEAHVSRLRKAGAVILGKTNVSQLLLFVESDNPVYGRTSNPWNLERTCGGSSGGEGAIVAAGGSALGLGNDIGGSCRYPANFCGIAGFKPTAGRCPDTTRYSMSRGQQAIRSQVGVLARSADDIALGLRTIEAGYDAGGDPIVPLGDHRTVDLGKLRVGFYGEDGMLASAPSVRRAVKEAAASLSAAGATVGQWTPPGIPDAFHYFYALLSADGAKLGRETLGRDPIHATLKPLLLLAGRSRTTLRGVGGLLRSLGQKHAAHLIAQFGHTRTADYWRLVEGLLDYQERFAQAMRKDGIDLILGPACAVPAFVHGATRDIGLGGAHALLYNVLGYPAGTVRATHVSPGEETDRPRSSDMVEKTARRCELGSAGLPVGVQIAARPWRDHEALAAMRVVTAARDSAL